MELVTGIILGAVLIGFVAMIVLLVRIAFVVTETLVILKTAYVELNRISQMSQATMNAAEGFVDALGETAQQYSQTRMGIPPFIMKMGTGKLTPEQIKEITKNDIEELRKLFEDNLNSDDDDDDPKEPWEGKK